MVAVQLDDLESRLIRVMSIEEYLENQSNFDINSTAIIAHDSSLSSLTGSQAIVTLLLSSVESSRNPFFHSGCAYLPTTGEIYTTSGLLTPSSSSKLPTVLISRITLRTATGDSPTPDSPSVVSVEWSKLRPPTGMAMPAGCIAFREGVLYAEQGGLPTGNSPAAIAGVLYMPHRQPPKSIARSYMGRPFNSPRGVALGPDSAVWFTDTLDGAKAGFRPKAELPCAVYRLDLRTMRVRALADGFERPVGVAVSPDGSTVYVAEAEQDAQDSQLQQPSIPTIYAFDVIERNGSVSLINKRLFANTLHHGLLMIQCDASGRLFAACSDGLEIWDSAANFLGVIQVPGGVTSFAFGSCNDIILGGSQRLWRVQLAAEDEEDETSEDAALF